MGTNGSAKAQGAPPMRFSRYDSDRDPGLDDYEAIRRGELMLQHQLDREDALELARRKQAGEEIYEERRRSYGWRGYYRSNLKIPPTPPSERQAAMEGLTFSQKVKASRISDLDELRVYCDNMRASR